MTWLAAGIIGALLLWWGRFWLAHFAARGLAWLARGRQLLPVRRLARRLLRYASR